MMQKDSAILHFLKNFPPWIVLAAITALFVSLYKITGDVAFKEWTGLSLASLFTALGVRAQQPNPTTEITADSVQTPAINNQTMDNAQITAANITTDREGENL